MSNSNSLGTSFIFKVLTAGDGGVGKTSLLHRYVNNSFKEDMKLTIGVEFFMKEVDIHDGNEYRLQLWDFGGESQFKHVLPSYIKGAMGAILMIDLTRTITIRGLAEWVDLLTNENPNLPIVFVGTKLDLVDQISVEDEYALEQKDRFNLIDYIKVSSKTGENISKVFEILTENLIKFI